MNLEGKHVLVTGASGLIGYNLLQRLSTIPDIKVEATLHENDKILYITYVSGRGFLEDATFEDLRLYGVAHPDWIFYLHEIDENLKDGDGNPILADGSFRLIQVLKETKYPDEIQKYEQQLY